MNFGEYIEAVKKGKIVVGTGRAKGGRILDDFTVLDSADAEAVTAEGFRLGVFPLDTEWDAALRMVEDELEEKGKALNGEPFCGQGGAAGGFRAYP